MKPDMRARFSILMASMLFILIALMNFNPIADTYVGMQIQTAGGKPYLMLAEQGEEEDQGTFSVYAPSGKDFERWVPVYENRSGQVVGTFEIPVTPGKAVEPDKKDPAVPTLVPAPATPPAGAPKRIEGLGIFFRSRAAVFDVTKADPNAVVATMPLTMDWDPEAASELNGQVYAFGARQKKDENGAWHGVLKWARFDGQNWVEPKELAGPEVHQGKAGFWLKAVTLEGRIAVLWRAAKWDQTISPSVEGFRTSTDGEIGLVFFDGTKFSAAPVFVQGLPKGNTCIWTEKGVIKCLVQTRTKGVDADKGPKGRMEIWDIDPGNGAAKLSDTIASERNALGIFSHIAAEHFVWEKREYILRSTWQKFELWRRTDGGKWEVVPDGAASLPRFSLERKLYTALGVCAAFVLMGAWLGVMRRRQALTLMRKLQPNDVYAPLFARAGAFLVDMLAVIGLAVGVARLFSDQYAEIFPSLIGIPSTHTLVCFLIYFMGFEWLFGATPGKFLMGLRVVMDGGQRLTFWAALVRNTVGVVERQMLMLIVTIPVLIFSPRRQRIGDLLSRTFVVQKQGLDAFVAQRAAALKRGEVLDNLPLEPDEKKNEKRRGQGG